MRNYGETPIDELIEEYATLAKDPLVIAYNEVSEELFKRAERNYRKRPETEFYKAACGYEYTLELPYDELHVSHDRAWVKHHDYSFTYKEPDGRIWNSCLSLCGYSREQIVEMIDKRIEKLLEEAEEGGDD